MMLREVGVCYIVIVRIVVVIIFQDRRRARILSGSDALGGNLVRSEKATAGATWTTHGMLVTGLVEVRLPND